MKTKKIKNLWGGNFEELPDSKVFEFTAGKDVYPTLAFDVYLLPYDLWASKVHCLMLLEQKIIDKDSAKAILSGLDEIEELYEKGEFELDPQKEDVHTNIEAYLTEKIGIEKAGKLHTARSRNDQVAVATRLLIKDKVLEAVQEILFIIKALLEKAEKTKDIISPGFTHYQHAMPTSFAHILLFYASSFLRDAKRFLKWFDLYNKNPLGAAAGYGTSFPIDQKFTSELLGFDSTEFNTIDPISNRWEPEAEYIFSLTIFLKHLSSLAQTFIVFSTPEFSFITLPDKYTTGSSIMPQKKNPDILEVIKAKSAYISGLLSGLLNLSQGYFIGYNRDSQWSKYMLLHAVQDVEDIGKIVSEVIRDMNINKEVLEKTSRKAFITATNLLEQICDKYKIPFRIGKILIEKSIKYSKNKDKIDYVAFQKALKEIKLDINLSKKDFYLFQDPKICLQKNYSIGGPSKKALEDAIRKFGKEVVLFEETLKKRKSQRLRCLRKLKVIVKSLF